MMKSDAPQLQSLETSTQPLEAFYNEETDRPRFLAVLSPTCPGCIQGANAIQHAILDAFPGAFDVGLIWIPMLADDTETAIEQAASEFADEEVSQFADPNRIAGKSLAEALGAADGIAWDIYMFYESVAQWTSSPPEPTDWVHQLASSSWTPPERYRCGCSDDLTESLRQLAAQTGREASKGQP